MNYRRYFYLGAFISILLVGPVGCKIVDLELKARQIEAARTLDPLVDQVIPVVPK